MALPVSSSLIAAQAQGYAAAKPVRAYAPPAVEKLAARGSSNAVQVEISAEAREAQEGRLAPRRDAASTQAGARTAGADPKTPRDFTREAPLRGFEARDHRADAQQNAGTRNTRPGTTLDIRI